MASPSGDSAVDSRRSERSHVPRRWTSAESMASSLHFHPSMKLPDWKRWTSWTIERAWVRRVVAVAGVGLAAGLVLVGVAIGWGWWRYQLPDPRTDVPPTVQLFAAGQPLAIYQGDGRRAQTWVPLERIPRSVVDAVLAAEDRRFFEHPGVDVVGIARAFTSNVRRSDVVQGGSTLTQQLARTLYLGGAQRGWGRKLREMGIALQLELRYGKAQILEAYLNTIYLGHDHDVAVHGVAAAARRFLGKELHAVLPDEAAYLAAAIRAPNRLLAGDGQARPLRDGVLRTMAARGTLADDAMRAALARPLPRRPKGAADRHGYFVDVARAEIERRASLSPGSEARIETTLDPRLQSAAEAAVQTGLEQLERRRKLGPGTLQAAVVAIEPSTGAVRALVGGRRYADSQFNRATRAQRQPGSLFKPFVYLAAFETPSGAMVLTPASVIADEPVAIRAAEGSWRPRNIDGQFHGPVTVRRALEQSLNVPAARVAQAVGVRSVARVANALGVQSPLVQVPSLALGSSEVTLLEMTAAFAAIANGGVRVAPTTIAPGGAAAAVVAPAPPPVQAVSATSAFLITHVLRGVMRSGTGSASARYGLAEITAGKTGTTNDLRDSWFVGYTPDLVVGVWVGRDDGNPVGMTGSDAALPIWGTVMQSAVRRAAPRSFLPPEGVVMAQVERATGRRASAWCGYDDVVVEAFREGTEPGADCVVPPVVTAGAETVFGWLSNLFR